MKRAIFAVLSVCFASVAFAGGTVGPAHVVAIRINPDGTGMVQFDQIVSGSPNCAGTYAPYNSMLSFGNTSQGKEVLALALTAKAMGSTIQAIGLGSCINTSGSVEDWGTGWMN
ncbi:MAG TPA: hypothetical protein VIF82_13585 [Burkholderiaceae bacterium]|jgi:hypothetical protein